MDPILQIKIIIISLYCYLFYLFYNVIDDRKTYGSLISSAFMALFSVIVLIVMFVFIMTIVFYKYYDYEDFMIPRRRMRRR